MADVTPNDIINKEFHRALRGYAPEEVDDFLQQVSDSLFRALDDNQRLRAQATELRERLQQYQQTEDLIKNALVLAERSAEDARQRAHEHAEAIIREAEERTRAEQGRVEELRQTRNRIIAEIRAILHAHLSMLESQEGR